MLGASPIGILTADIFLGTCAIQARKTDRADLLVMIAHAGVVRRTASDARDGLVEARPGTRRDLAKEDSQALVRALAGGSAAPEDCEKWYDDRGFELHVAQMSES